MAKASESIEDHPARIVRTTVRFTKQNYNRLTKQAAKEGIPLAAFIAQAALEKISRPSPSPTEPSPPSTPRPD